MRIADQIGELYKNNKPFFMLRRAGAAVVKLLSQDSADLITSAPLGFVYAIFCGFDPTKTVFIRGDKVDQLKFPTYSIDARENYQIVKPAIDDSQKTRYTQLVKKAIDACEQGELVKVVLSRKRTYHNPHTITTIIERLLAEYPDANCYCFHHPRVGTWIGASPETLVSYDNGKVKTMSLAGTAPYNGSLDHSWGEKEKREQQLVTDKIIDDLNQFSKDIKTHGPKTSKAGKLIHLQTEITAQIDPSDLNDLVERMHPTPAVCGLPVTTAKEFIIKNENYDRSFYTGYFGWVDQKNSTADYYVNLRCMQLENDLAHIYVGGGIVKDSDSESEYLETVAKEQTMLKLL